MGNPRKKPKHLAAKLLRVRQNLGLSQPQLAHRLNLLDLGQRYYRISEYETGRREPSLMVLLAYARAGNVTVESLIDDKMELTPLR